MIRFIKARNFAAVPWLETSQLMQAHTEGVTFSTEKPNVIVGPNGAGKSALLTALSYRTLTYWLGVSSLDNKYVGLFDAKGLWETVSRWERVYRFLPGLECETDNAPALYYRPSHIPGNEDMVAAAMMTGYFEEAKEYGMLTREKSSGQQSRALLERVQAALEGDVSHIAYDHVNWHYGVEQKEMKDDVGFRYSETDFHAETLKRMVASVEATAVPLVLMDEPEQSLDAKAETLLWRQIAAVDSSRVQVIVATHSLYPLMHPESFNLIEAVPGYAEEVRALL